MPKINIAASDDTESAQLCTKCGSIMVLEDGELICPHCDTEIDYFGDDDDDI